MVWLWIALAAVLAAALLLLGAAVFFGIGRSAPMSSMRRQTPSGTPLPPG